MNFRDVIASLPAQRLLPGHGVADLISFFRFPGAPLSSEHASGASTFDRANGHHRLRATGKRTRLSVDRALANTSRAALTAPVASLMR